MKKTFSNRSRWQKSDARQRSIFKTQAYKKLKMKQSRYWKYNKGSITRVLS